MFQETADPIVLGIFGALRVAPYVLLSVPAGYVADRFDRRLVLLATDVLRGLCMLGMAAVAVMDGPVAWIVGLSVVAACGSTFFYPAIGAYIPNLARDERELGPANSLWATLDNFGYIIGPALGGLLVAGGGVVFAFLVNAATFAVIAAVLLRLPPSSNVARTADTPAAPSDAAAPASPVPTETASAAPRQRVPLRPFLGLLLVGFVLYGIDGGVAIVSVVLAFDVLGAGEAATGYLTAAVGVGGVVGGLAAGSMLLRPRLSRPLLIGSAISGVALVALSVVKILPVALVAFAVYAFGYFLVDVVLTTIMQRILPDRLRGRGIGVFVAVGTLGEMLGSLVLPVLVGAAGIAILGPTSILLVGSAVVGLLLIGPASTRAPTPAEATFARASRGPLFAGVPAHRLELALGRLQPIVMAAGQTVIRQGEPADRFYLVETGTLEVTQRDDDGAEHALRKLGPNDVFGELGLLTGAPRSATVTATTDGSLLALDGPAFLELVGGGGKTRGRLLTLYTSTPSRSS